MFEMSEMRSDDYGYSRMTVIKWNTPVSGTSIWWYGQELTL